MKKRYFLPAVAAAAALSALSGTQPSAAAESLAEAVTAGKAGVSFRYRFEQVDQDAFAEDASASTLRGRLNFGTDPWNGFSAFAEVDYVTDLFWDDYNAGFGNSAGKEQYPVVADPTGPDLNQAYLQWAGAKGTRLRGGRQRINLDNQRFVGAVGWRQNEQTFDAVHLQQKAAGFDLQLAWLWQANRIFGRDVAAGRHDMGTALVNLAKEWEGRGKLSVYYYDIDNDDAPLLSSATWGTRWAGSRPLSSAKLVYALEYARQSDAHNHPASYGADYYRGDLSVGFRGVTPYLGYESLGGDESRAGAAFQTPLATLHGFNGWADKFLTTPDAGLDDLFLGLKGGFGVWKWDAIYHDFEAESGSQSFGSELDASLSRKIGKHYELLLKAAWFDGEPGTPYDDTAKYWLQLTADFE